MLAKSKVKSLMKFALSRNRLLQLLDEQALPNRIDVKSACQNLECCLETSMEVLDKLSEFCIENKQIDEAFETVSKMDTLLAEYSSAYDAAHRYSNTYYTGHNILNAMTEPAHVRVSEQHCQESTAGGISQSKPEARGASTIEQDLWKQLKRIEIPVFNGDKRKYESWKAVSRVRRPRASHG